MSWIAAAIMALSLNAQSASTQTADGVEISGEPLTVWELTEGGPFSVVIVDVHRDEDGQVTGYSGGFVVWVEQARPEQPITTFRPVPLGVDQIRHTDGHGFFDPDRPEVDAFVADPVSLLEADTAYAVVFDELRDSLVAIPFHSRLTSHDNLIERYCSINFCRHLPIEDVEVENCAPAMVVEDRYRRLFFNNLAEGGYHDDYIIFQPHGCDAVSIYSETDLLMTLRINKVIEIESGFRLELQYANSRLDCKIRAVGPRSFECTRPDDAVGLEIRGRFLPLRPDDPRPIDPSSP